MSSLFLRHARARIDAAVSHVYRTADAPMREGFSRLLARVGRRAVSVEALGNFARFADHFVRAPEEWPGCAGPGFRALQSLAQHLFSYYEMPRFLALVWAAPEEAPRRWYVAHGAGARFRDLELPIAMTRRMEDLFLRSPDHLAIGAALRRAQLLALGAGDALVDALLATRLAHDLSHDDFWSSVMTFMVRNHLPLDQVAPVIDFLHAIRIERVALDDGSFLEPPQPEFSLKGRTAKSLLRLVEAWHRGLGLAADARLSWPRSRQQPLRFREETRDPSAKPVVWELIELTTSAQLQMEGRALQHCVASYTYSCRHGLSRIWSLRRRVDERARSIVTVEIDPRRDAIVQARGFRNRFVSGRSLELIHAWAAREKLRLAI